MILRTPIKHVLSYHQHTQGGYWVGYLLFAYHLRLIQNDLEYVVHTYLQRVCTFIFYILFCFGFWVPTWFGLSSSCSVYAMPWHLSSVLSVMFYRKINLTNVKWKKQINQLNQLIQKHPWFIRKILNNKFKKLEKPSSPPNFWTLFYWNFYGTNLKGKK